MRSWSWRKTSAKTNLWVTSASTSPMPPAELTTKTWWSLPTPVVCWSTPVIYTTTPWARLPPSEFQDPPPHFVVVQLISKLDNIILRKRTHCLRLCDPQFFVDFQLGSSCWQLTEWSTRYTGPSPSTRRRASWSAQCPLWLRWWVRSPGETVCPWRMSAPRAGVIWRAWGLRPVMTSL